MNEAAPPQGVAPDPDGTSSPPSELLLARRFHRDAGLGIAGHPVVAAVLAILIWGLVPVRQMAAAVGVICAATVVRSLLHRRAARHLDDARALRRGTRASTLLVAVAWGLVALLLLPDVPSGIQPRILLFLAGLTAAGAATHVADARGFRLFAGLMFGPAMVGIALGSHDARTPVDLLVIAVYWATMVLIQKRANEQLVEQLATRARLQESTRRATQEKEFLDAVLDSAPDGMALLDPRGRLARMNALFRRTMWPETATDLPPDEVPSAEFPPTLQSFRGRDPLWDALAGAARDLGHAPERGGAEREVVLTRGGERRWYTVSATPGRDEAAGWTVVQIEDITSLRLAEQARRDAEAEYAELVETANDLIWRVDRHGRWTFLNGAAETIYGSAPHTLLGRSAMDHAVAEHRNADYEALAGILDGGEIVGYETRHERADGSVRWLSFSARPMRDDDGRIVGAQGVARDVTAQVRGRQALERLAERNSLVRSLINASEDLIFYKDQDGVYQGCNAAFATFVGLHENDIVGYTDEELYPPDEVALYRTTDAEVLRTGEPWVGESWEEMGPDAERRLLETVKTPFVDTDGTVLGILGIGRDVTARKEAEERMRHAAEEARRATQMKSAFLANMSHEIRTPMNGVLGMAELLQGTELDPEQRQYVDIVRSSAQNLLGILNDILDFSKIEAGHLELEAIPFDLPGEMADALRVLTVNAAAKGDELLLDADPAVPEWVLGDPGRMRQVVTNLLGNAVKFTEQGEIVLALEVVEPPERPGGPHLLRVAVRDSGIGIPEDKLPLIFEEFSQADSSVTRRFGGTGLGLTICRRLVELMGGEIGVDSVLGEGSTFWFTVPLLAVDAPEEAGERAPVAPHSLAGKRILVVDDNATNRDILRRILGRAGADLDEAAGGDEALARLAELQARGRLPDLVIMDVQMPEMDGLEVVRRMRREMGGAVGELPVVVLTSANRTEDTSRARALGVQGYHLKPLPGRELLQVVGRHMGDALPAPMAPAPTGGDVSRPPAAAATVPGTREADGSTSDEEAEGIRILLAEDNPVNRMVAETMLRKQGYRVVPAFTGAEAVSAVEAGRVATVLMDVQMPEMDGIEATRAIRRLPHPLGNVPIVALTAHALEEERQRCLAAGMDDFLSKPFHGDDLAAVLDRWVSTERGQRAAMHDGSAGATRPGLSRAPDEAVPPPRSSGGSDPGADDTPRGGGAEQSGAGTPGVPAADGVPPVDVAAFRALMEEAGIGAVVGPTLQLFLRDLPSRVDAVAEAVEADDAAGTAQAAHALKSSAANVRATRLAGLLERLEATARSADLSPARELEKAIRSEADRVRAYLASE